MFVTMESKCRVLCDSHGYTIILSSYLNMISQLRFTSQHILSEHVTSYYTFTLLKDLTFYFILVLSNLVTTFQTLTPLVVGKDGDLEIHAIQMLATVAI